MDDFFDVDFNASDARTIVHGIRSEKDKMYHKLHAQIVLKIKREAEKGRLYATYRVPIAIPGFTKYDPEKALIWLIKRFEKDGFKVQVQFRERYIAVVWGKLNEDDGLGKAPKTTRKSVRFKVPDSNVFHF